MTEEILDNIIDKMCEHSASKAYDYSDQLVRIGGGDVLKKMIDLLQSDNDEVQYLASRTLGLMDDHEEALTPLLEVIFDNKNKSNQGMLAEYLDEYDCSQQFVKVFKLYLFGSVKASGMAKEVLDYEEFDITPRVIRKAEKQWNHYISNVKQDEAFELMKKDTEEFLGELKALFIEG
jgi:hypothetical protein